MKKPSFGVALGARALTVSTLSASNALAGATATCTTSGGTVVSITDPSTCHFETGATCTSACTPVSTPLSQGISSRIPFQEQSNGSSPT